MKITIFYDEKHRSMKRVFDKNKRFSPPTLDSTSAEDEIMYDVFSPAEKYASFVCNRRPNLKSPEMFPF